MKRLSRDHLDRLGPLLEQPDFLGAWPEVCRRINGSRFCRGHGRRGFVATLGWALRPETWQRVLEGEYDDPGTAMPKGFWQMAPEERAAFLRQRISSLEQMAQSIGYDPPDLVQAREALASLEGRGSA